MIVPRAHVAALASFLLATPPITAQTVRVAGWGTYEGVTGSQDWSSAGAQVTFGTARGHRVWLAAEVLGRFGETDVTERIGGVVHPTPRLWLSAEAGTALRPVFSPRNTWEMNATVLIAPRASLGLGYRRWNYAAGPVDVLMPHVTMETSKTSWTARVFVSRNPTRRWDTAASLRVTRALSRRTTGTLLGAAGRESYFVAGSVQSLETVTGGAGIRYNAGSGMTVRFDASVIRSRPVLSRRGIQIGLERGL